jgi:hypothetical protein
MLPVLAFDLAEFQITVDKELATTLKIKNF